MSFSQNTIGVEESVFVSCPMSVLNSIAYKQQLLQTQQKYRNEISHK